MPQNWDDWFGKQVGRAYLTAQELREYHEYLDSRFALIERRLDYLEAAHLPAEGPEPDGQPTPKEPPDGGR